MRIGALALTAMLGLGVASSGAAGPEHCEDAMQPPNQCSLSFAGYPLRVAGLAIGGGPPRIKVTLIRASEPTKILVQCEIERGQAAPCTAEAASTDPALAVGEKLVCRVEGRLYGAYACSSG